MPKIDYNTQIWPIYQGLLAAATKDWHNAYYGEAKYPCHLSRHRLSTLIPWYFEQANCVSYYYPDNGGRDMSSIHTVVLFTVIRTSGSIGFLVAHPDIKEIDADDLITIQHYATR